MSDLPGNRQGTYAPSATVGSIDGKGNVDQNTQVAGRDIDQSSIGYMRVSEYKAPLYDKPLILLKVYDNSRHFYINLGSQIKPQQDEYIDGIFHNILVEISDGRSTASPTGGPLGSLEIPMNKRTIPKSSSKFHLHQVVEEVIEALRPKLHKEGYMSVEVANTASSDGNTPELPTDPSTWEAGSHTSDLGAISNIDNSEQSVIHPSSDTDKVASLSAHMQAVSPDGLLGRDNTPELTTDDDSHEELEQEIPLLTTEILPISLSGKKVPVPPNSSRGSLEDEKQQTDMRREAKTQQPDFTSWLIWHLIDMSRLYILSSFLSQWLWEWLYEDGCTSLETSVNLPDATKDDIGGFNFTSQLSGHSNGEEYIVDEVLDLNQNRDASPRLNNSHLLSFQTWRDPPPWISSTSSKSSYGSRDSISAQYVPPALLTMDSLESLYRLCEEPFDIGEESDGEDMNRITENLRLLSITSCMISSWEDIYGYKGESSKRKDTNHGGVVRLQRELSSEETKELLGIPSENFGYPRVRSVITLKLGVRQRGPPAS